MLRLFIDSSVLMAMCISAKGASRELMRLAIRHQVELVTSTYVLDETEINLSVKSPRSLSAYRYIRSRTIWKLIDASRKEAAAAEVATPDVFDSPIIAAARKAKVDAPVTFDRKHLIRQSVSDYIGAVVTTPDQIVKRIRAEKH